MKDQVDALRKRSISAVVMDSSKSRDEHLDTMHRLRAGAVRLLYCAPERLNNEGFVECLRSVRGGVRMVAVDEAHCISEVASHPRSSRGPTLTPRSGGTRSGLITLRLPVSSQKSRLSAWCV